MLIQKLINVNQSYTLKSINDNMDQKVINISVSNPTKSIKVKTLECPEKDICQSVVREYGGQE